MTGNPPQDRAQGPSRRAFQPVRQMSLGPEWESLVNRLHQQGTPEHLQEGAGEGTQVSVSVPTATAPRIVSSGVIRNGFDPESAGHLGMNGFAGDRYKGLRKVTEHYLFGIPMDADHTQRPVYGYHRAEHDLQPGPYGNTVLNVHPQGRHVTTTPSDSLNEFGQYEAVSGYENSGASLDEIRQGAAEEISPETLVHGHEPGRTLDYHEVQVHGGGIPLEHVTRAHIFRDGSAEGRGDENAARDAFRAKGIPTEVMVHKEYQPTLSESRFGTGKVGWVNEEDYSR